MHDRIVHKLIAAAIVATTVILLPKKHNHISSCESIMSKLPHTGYERLCGSVDGSKGKDREFWIISERVKGLLKRVRISWLCLMLIQAFHREGLLTAGDALEMWYMFAGQLAYTALSIPEAIACMLFGGVRHVIAKESVRFYCDLVIATNVKCYIKEAPLCVMGLPELL
jgi:hypothetical protein